MKIQKRDGTLVDYDINKISIALSGAFEQLGREFDDEQVLEEIENTIIDVYDGEVSVEDIQDIVESILMFFGYYDEAKEYIKYRYRRELIRKANTTDKAIKELLEGDSEYWNTENSNKNAKVAHTQRDYIAGITSTDITRRFLLPKDVVEAHDAGLIHFHELIVA